MQLIGIVGRARAGKDTIANHLVEVGKFTKLAFADPLKEMALKLNPAICRKDGFQPLLDLVHQSGWDKAKKNGHVRRFLQTLGTEVGREMIDENLWLYLMAKRMQKHGRVVIPDVRFQNEFMFVSNRGGILIGVTRPDNNEVPTTHKSESEVEQLYKRADVQIVNDGTVEDLKKKVTNSIVDIAVGVSEDWEMNDGCM